MIKTIVTILLSTMAYQANGQALMENQTNSVTPIQTAQPQYTPFNGKKTPITPLIRQEEISLELSKNDELSRHAYRYDRQMCRTLKLSGWMDVNKLGEIKKYFPKIQTLDLGQLKLKSYPNEGGYVNYLESATHLPYRFFYNHKHIETVILPDTITQIGEFAFGNCQHLRKVMHAGELTVIKPYAFIGCRKLEFTIPNSVTNIEYNSFAGCKFPKKLELPEKLSFIEKPGWQKIKRYVISENNETYTTKEGLLLNKKNNQLVLNPRKR